MARKALLISPELCIGCRGCQTACKAWNQLPATKTANKGSAENPPDLTPNLYNKIRYVEMPSETNTVRWLFVSQRCMHCDDAGCIKICPAPGALFKTKEGATAFNKDNCIGCKLCVAACPFNVPRYDEKEKISKCNLCSDRIADGLAPACAKTCPTGAIRYGDRDKIIGKAQEAGYQKLYGQMDLGGLGVLYAFKDSPKIYGMDEHPQIPETVVFWHKVLKPLAYLGLGGAVAASLLHYIAIGPKKDEEVK
ncbi:MAG: 4Fe-4S dicluster domain-containing protein [Nitrospiraceae bacterium]|nr:4Fe-4S dicluster domain-containing protein [Nitrospirota bacterium]MDA8338280.1 4Fe-4S dicluster domain-containing protein [Nitrospiraceae bacterium]